MLQVSSPLGTYVLHCSALGSMQLAVAWLITHSVSFYVEPFPDDEWHVTVNLEHKHLLEQLANSVGWGFVL